MIRCRAVRFGVNSSRMPAKRSKQKSGAAKPPGDTPAMRQFRQFKEQHPDCVLFFRMGDFYEMFHEDAKLAHRVLGVTLTQRTEGVPMAGVPYHAVEGYLRRMIQAGYRVAVCDQVEDPKDAKGVVKRDVTRVVTPGTLTDEALLEEGAENVLASVMFHEDDRVSLAWTELSTGAFAMTTLDAAAAGDELARLGPREVLFVETANNEPPPRVRRLLDAVGCVGTARPGWQFRLTEARQTLERQFQVAQLAGFGIADDDPAIGPAGAIVAYLLETQRTADGASARRLAHLQPPRRFTRDDHLVIDQTSLRSLEVEQTIRAGTVEGSVLGVFAKAPNHPVTAMGKRLMRNWLCYPLTDLAAIEHRQHVVGACVDDSRFLDELREALGGVQDVQRIAGRIAVGRATPRDLVALGRSTGCAETLLGLLAALPTVAVYHDRLAAHTETLAALARRIGEACVESPPPHLREGGLIRDGHDKQLDEHRLLQRDSNAWLARYQKELSESTRIPSLKIGYNKVFGFYIELTAAHRDKAPQDWTRKQTLKNAERFITPALKEYEGKVLAAEQSAIAREQELFARLCAMVQEDLPALHAFAAVVAELDVLGAFARRAVRYRYVKPTVVEQPVLHIAAGRHPVLDELLGDQFVPNDVHLGPREASGDAADQALEPSGADSPATLAMITGPNMAGKSTYIRQTALIALLAHTGSFVPADEAVVGRCDRIFTRVGASDELHAGQSTFMVEMTETANLCHHATPHSLVILDEIGRGTSTLDGLSLAWAIAEHLALRRCRTLFATHYHEITQLSETYANITNLNVTVREWQDEIVFLHRIAPGSTDRSYGIHVAKIAGLPADVIGRANDVLSQLALSHNGPGGGVTPGSMPPPGPAPAQLSLFTEYIEHPALERLRTTDLNALSPMQAFDLLREIRRQLDNG